MSKRRYVALGFLGLCAIGGALLAVPRNRHLIRQQIAQHRSIRFGSVVAVPVVPVVKELPVVVAADALNPAFAPQPLASFAVSLIRAPRLDASAFATPVVTRARETVAAAMDETTMAAAAPAKTAEALLTPDLAGARQALRHYHEGDLGGGDEFARLTDGPLRVALDWAAVRLASRQAGPDRLQAFAATHADWPQRIWLDRRVEEARAATRDDAAVLALFNTDAPETLTGRLALARARLATGDVAASATLARSVWRDEDLTPAEEASVLHDFSALLRGEDHKARADRLFYKESVAAALRAAQLAGPDVALLGKARAAVVASAPSDAAIAAVPKALQADPGLVFAKLQKARRANHIAEAAALMFAAPTDPATLIDPDAWWVERRLIARKLLDLGDPQTAYRIAAGAVAASHALRIEAAFHAGWIALRFLNQPVLAAPHFALASSLAETPISVARGAYWQARTAESMGDAAAASRFYAAAATQPTTFYGQLATARLGRGPIALRAGGEAAEGDARHEAIAVVEMLFALGERDLAVALALAEAKSEKDEAQVAALARVVEATQDARATLLVGKAATQRGMAVDEAAFPTFGIPAYRPFDNSADRSTVFAIARQESEFDPHAVSAAGAKGLMQVIASTARQTAQAAGAAFDEGRLLNDAGFNAQIGAAHLGKLLTEEDGSYILTFAAYNAGSRKVREWIATYGDPRKPGVDAIDWIERIPFTETRNYVQRVFENMQVYRTRFGVPVAELPDPGPAAGGKGT